MSLFGSDSKSSGDTKGVGDYLRDFGLAAGAIGSIAVGMHGLTEPTSSQTFADQGGDYAAVLVEKSSSAAINDATLSNNDTNTTHSKSPPKPLSSHNS